MHPELHVYWWTKIDRVHSEYIFSDVQNRGNGLPVSEWSARCTSGQSHHRPAPDPTDTKPQ